MADQALRHPRPPNTYGYFYFCRHARLLARSQQPPVELTDAELQQRWAWLPKEDEDYQRAVRQHQRARVKRSYLTQPPAPALPLDVYTAAQLARLAAHQLQLRRIQFLMSAAAPAILTLTLDFMGLPDGTLLCLEPLKRQGLGLHLGPGMAIDCCCLLPCVLFVALLYVVLTHPTPAPPVSSLDVYALPASVPRPFAAVSLMSDDHDVAMSASREALIGLLVVGVTATLLLFYVAFITLLARCRKCSYRRYTRWRRDRGNETEMGLLPHGQHSQAFLHLQSDDRWMWGQPEACRYDMRERVHRYAACWLICPGVLLALILCILTLQVSPFDAHGQTAGVDPHHPVSAISASGAVRFGCPSARPFVLNVTALSSVPILKLNRSAWYMSTCDASLLWADLTVHDETFTAIWPCASGVPRMECAMYALSSIGWLVGIAAFLVIIALSHMDNVVGWRLKNCIEDTFG